MGVPAKHRLLLSVVMGLLAACMAAFRAATESHARDFDALWNAARALLAGQDPYSVTPGVLYPLPSIVAAIPWALVSSHTAANALCMFVGATAFAWALMEHGTAPLFGMGSASLLYAAQVVQWTPMLAGSVAIAPLTLLLITKPQTGLAIFCARPTWWAVVGGLSCIAVAFALDPTWLQSWRASLALSGGHLGVAPTGFPYTAPMLLPGGALILLAVVRWRRPEARLLVALACAPQSMLLYETVLLFLVPRTFRESALLVALSYIALDITGQPFPDLAQYAVASGRISIFLLYLPCVVMVLRRPNEGLVPDWLERRIAAWPLWLRGVAHT
jgi:hypothetical protein